MNVDIKILKDIIRNAIEDFNKRHKYLLGKDLSERCICSAFALCVENSIPDKKEFEDVFVDVEYNRGQRDDAYAVKRLGKDKNIVVDLIVHKRGCTEEGDNLICIEMKKSNNREGQSGDEQRIRKMTDRKYGFKYSLGYLILADMKSRKLCITKEFKLI